MHIQPEPYSMPKFTWYDSWTHAIFQRKPALHSQKSVVRERKVFYVMSQHCVWVLLQNKLIKVKPLCVFKIWKEKKIKPFDKGNPYFQASDMLFVELRRIVAFVQNHLKPGTLHGAFCLLEFSIPPEIY